MDGADLLATVAGIGIVLAVAGLATFGVRYLLERRRWNRKRR